MGLFPEKRIKKRAGLKLIIDTCPWNGRDLEHNSDICKIPFTGKTLYWFDKQVSNKLPVKDQYHRDMVEVIWANTNLYPVIREYQGDLPDGYPGEWKNYPLVTNDDWDRCPVNYSHGEFMTTSGHPAGSFDLIYNLHRKYGITYFGVKDLSVNVASIGFSPQNQKWYGWSHRAIHGFGIGDGMFKCWFEDEPECRYAHPGIEGCNECIYDIMEPNTKITDLEQAKQVAKLFAGSVS